MGEYLVKALSERLGQEASHGSSIEVVLVGLDYGTFQHWLNRIRSKRADFSGARELSFATGVGRFELRGQDPDQIGIQLTQILSPDRFVLLEKSPNKYILQAK
ncbi:hypothetical protein D3C87_1179490 [compost metagenome]